MSHPFPLQSADVAPNFSGRDSSTAADRRADVVSPVTAEAGTNRAGNYHEAQAPLWRKGQMAPDIHTPPFNAIQMNGDGTDGVCTEVYEIDMQRYADAYDPTAPLRVREVGSEWTMDTDADGHRN